MDKLQDINLKGNEQTNWIAISGYVNSLLIYFVFVSR